MTGGRTKAVAEPRFLAACARRPGRTPVWLMRQAGRYLPEYRRLRAKASLIELCERPELAAEVTLQPVRRFAVDAAILFADILLTPRAMGLSLEFRKGEGPALAPPVRTRRAIERLREPDIQESLGFVLETIRLVRRELPREVALIGFAGAPFTVASYMVEGGPSDHYLAAKAMMRSDPVAWDRLMSKIARVTAAYLKAQVAAGAQAVQLFDSWAGALSGPDYERYARPYSAAVLAALAPTGAPTIHFGTGTAGFLESFAAAGGDVVGVDWRIPLDAAWKRIGPRRGVQGNLDPAILAAAPRRELLKAVDDVLRRAGGRPGHIFNLGHGVLPVTKPEHVAALVDRVREAGTR